MKRPSLVLCFAIAASLSLVAQQPTQPTPAQGSATTANVTSPAPMTSGAPAVAAAPARYTVPAGTRILMQLKSPITTKNAYPGEPVYAETTFPITGADRILIPPGSYVQGTIDAVKRPGRVKGRAEVQMHFNTLILPSGKTVSLPGQLASAPSGESETVNGAEGTISENPNKGRDAATVAGTTATGAGIGAAAARSMKGLGVGSGIGAAAGLATVLFTRGNDIRFDIGTPIEMTLQRPLVLEEPSSAPQRVLVPVVTNHTLKKSEDKRYVPTVPSASVDQPFPDPH